MNIKLETLIAIRYFRSRRDESFISISSLFSFLGITIGVATLIIVMSVMNGFRAQLIDKIVGINGHLILYFNDESYKQSDVIEKIETICKKIYRADEVIADKTIRDQLQSWEENGYGNLPVCMAKTQYSFTTDPNRRGAPTGHSIPIREVRLSAGAGFIVVVCGDIMTMPGLPKIPSAENIYLNENSQIEGLF